MTHTSRRRRGQPSARRLPRGSGCGFRHRAISCFDLHSNVGRTVLRATCRSGANVSVEPAPFVSRPFCLTLRESCGRDPPPVFARTCPSPRIPSGVSRDACLRTNGRSRREPGCCRFPLRFCLVCRVHRHYARLDGKPVPGASRLRGVHSSPTVLASISRAFPFPKASHQQPR